MRRREERRRKVVKVERIEGEEASIRLRTSFYKSRTISTKHHYLNEEGQKRAGLR